MWLPNLGQKHRTSSKFLTFSQNLLSPFLWYRPAWLGTLIFLVNIAPTTPVLASGDVIAALAAVDESDDRARPAAMLHLGFTPDYFARAYYYGRQQGAVSEDTQLLAGGYRFALFSKTSGLNAGIGASMMREATTIKAAALAAGTEDDLTSANYNFGMLFSLNWSPLSGPIPLNIGWDSHMFLAGQAGLFLATGRKQFISIGSGVRW